MLRKIEEIPQATNRLDLRQIDVRLDSLALTEVEPERLPILAAMLISKPEAQEPS
jgi:hypothetical protein